MGKGRGTEWEIATLLSQCWDKTGKDDIFMPTNSSGARATSRRKGGKETSFQGGDITFNDPIGKPLIDLFNIECKSGYCTKKKKCTTKTSINKSETEVIQRIIETPWDVLDFIDSNKTKTQLESFWDQCKDESLKTNRLPILIFRRNKRQLCIMITNTLFITIQNILGICELPKILLSFNNDFRNVIFNFYEFLNWVDPLEELIVSLTKVFRGEKK